MKRILLVDDSTTTQKLISITLANEPFELTNMLKVSDALNIIHSDPPDIVMVDVSMPEMNGFEFCREVKSRPSTSNVRVILLFGVFDEIDEAQVKSVGADGTLVKPFETKSLLEILDYVQLCQPKKLDPHAIPLNDFPLGEEERPSQKSLSAQSKQSLVGNLSRIDIDELWMGDEPKVSSKSSEQYHQVSSTNSLPKEQTDSFSPQGMHSKTLSNPLNPAELKNLEPSTATNHLSDLSPEELMKNPEIQNLVKKLAQEAVERIVWEVVPTTAKTVIRQEITKLLKELHS